MKPCHDNGGAAIYVGRTATVHNPGTFLLVSYSSAFPNLLCMVCAPSRPKMLTKTYNRVPVFITIAFY